MVAQNAGRDQVQHRFLAADHQCMAGVVPALKTHHALRVVSQPIDDLALALITPLGADYYYVFCHYRFLIAIDCFLFETALTLTPPNLPLSGEEHSHLP